MIFRVIIEVFKPSKESNDVVAVKVGWKISKQLLTGKIGNILVVPEAIKLRGLYIFILLLFHELKHSVLNINGVCSTIERFTFDIHYLYRYLNLSFSQSDVPDLPN